MVPLRDPAVVMRLARLGAMHQTRLSFMRILTRRMQRENWQFNRREFAIDAHGVGHAVYTVQGPKRAYSLIAFAHDLPADQRSDRVIAAAWDATFTLFDGVPEAADITRLAANIPLQEAGRVTERELSVSRANRSVRLWEHVVAALAAGGQPDAAQIEAVGYLMRTTAVYGSGKLGAADREIVADRAEFSAPFQVEMLSVYLTRWFVRDLVQHMAEMRGGSGTVTLDARLARKLGIGNSTGLGMAPFLLNHPVLFNNWIMARETALSRVRSVEMAETREIAMFSEMLNRAILSAQKWRSEHLVQGAKLVGLRDDLGRLNAHFLEAKLTAAHLWDRLYCWAEAELSIEGQEALVSLLIEPYSGLVDELAQRLADNVEPAPIDGAMGVEVLRGLIKAHYGWALAIDWQNRSETARAWYVSAEKFEPRLGERYSEPIAEYEQPLAPGRDVAALFAVLDDWRGGSLASFLLAHPEHRHSVSRVQIIARAPYGEIRDNTIAAKVLPIDMLRCKLGFFGAVHFDPRSDRWVRISMYGNAPYPNELATGDADYWVYPVGKGAML